MIKRSYFMHIEKSRDDGTGSFSYQYATFTHRSWFSQPHTAFRNMFEQIEADLKDKPGTACRVIAFNRI